MKREHIIGLRIAAVSLTLSPPERLTKPLLDKRGALLLQFRRRRMFKKLAIRRRAHGLEARAQAGLPSMELEPRASFAAIGVSTRTKHRNVRDQLIDLARGWTAIAQHERRSGARYFVYASHHFTRDATIKTTIEAVKM